MAGALALFAVWTLLSGGWSDAPARALVEFDRAALVPADAGLHRPARARPGATSRRCCGGWRWRSPAICAVAAADPAAAGRRSRPGRASTPSGSRSRSPTGTRWGCSRRSACVLTHAPDGERSASRAGVRVAAAAALPVVAVTLYLTFSRGGDRGAPIGLVALRGRWRIRAGCWRRCRRPRLPLAIALQRSPTAPNCSRAPTTPAAAARAQGALAAGRAWSRARSPRRSLRCAALRLDRARRARCGSAARTRAIAFGGAGLAVLLVLAVATVGRRPARAGSPTRARRSSSGNTPPGGADLRTRLTDGRQQRARSTTGAWRCDGLRREPVARRPARAPTGSTWERDRPAPPVQVDDGHSLYWRSLAELGVVGHRAAAGRASRCRSAWRSRACGGRSATPTRRSWPRARAAAARGGRLGLGDAGAVRLVLRRRRRGARRAPRRAERVARAAAG